MTKSDRYGPVARDALGVALHNHTPIERPAPGLSFDASAHSVGVQLSSADPFARPTGWTCWISLCLAGFVLSSRSSRCVGSRPTQPYTHRKACSKGLSFDAGLDSLRPQLLIQEPLARPAGWTCWISLCLAGLVLRSPNSRTVGSRPTNPYTHRKA